jgi:hypothetical protein
LQNQNLLKKEGKKNMDTGGSMYGKKVWKIKTSILGSITGLYGIISEEIAAKSPISIKIPITDITYVENLTDQLRDGFKQIRNGIDDDKDRWEKNIKKIFHLIIIEHDLKNLDGIYEGKKDAFICNLFLNLSIVNQA